MIATTATAECRQRLATLQTKVREHALDAFVVSSPENIYYLTGAVCHPLERPLLMLVWADRPPQFLVPLLEAEHIGGVIGRERVRTYLEYPAPPGQGWADHLGEMLGATASIGIEATLRAEISEGLRDRSLRPLPLIEQQRAVKSPAEVAWLRRAADCAVMGVERLLASSYYGSTVAEGFAQTRTIMKRILRESAPFNPLLSKVLMGTWAAPRSAQPHAIPRLDDRLLDGPHVALALTSLHGYAAECERTYFTSRPAQVAVDAFRAMMEARRRAFAMVRPGARCAEIDAATNAFLQREGYADARRHRAGHGLGLAYHAEAPWLAEGSQDVLAPGMVISVEPGIYLPEVGGLRHSDSVLVTDEGHECLTRFPSELEALILPRRRPLQRLHGAFTRWAMNR